MTGKLALPTLIALCSIALGRPMQSSTAVLGEISIIGTLIKVARTSDFQISGSAISSHKNIHPKKWKRECVRRDNPVPYATVKCNEDGIRKGVYNSVLFIKGNPAVGKIHL